MDPLNPLEPCIEMIEDGFVPEYECVKDVMLPIELPAVDCYLHCETCYLAFGSKKN